MDHSTRMLKTLAALAVAMTATAALLGKIDPKPIVPSPAIDADALARIARALVSDDAPIDYQYWQDVEVAFRVVPFPQGLLLAATSSPGDAHFLVDNKGRPFQGDAWRRQRTMPGRQGTIRIVVAIDDPSSDMSAAQQRSVEALLTALTDILRPQSGFLPVGFVDADAESADPSI